MGTDTYQVGIVVVSYHSDQLTIKMIKEQLTKLKGNQIVVVVNNGATPESSENIAQAVDGVLVKDITKDVAADSKCFVIHNEENSGFAKGNNIGVDFLTNHFKVDYLLFSNTDIEIIDDDVVDKLVAKLQNDQRIGIIGPRIVGLDGNCQSPSMYVPFWRHVLCTMFPRFVPKSFAKYFNPNNAKEGICYRVMGSFFVTSYRDYLKCGKMDEGTFLYCEEPILSERMKMIGKDTYYLPEVSILHAHGQTINKSVKVIQGMKISHRSHMYYFKKYKHVNSVSIFVANVLLYLRLFLKRVQFFLCR